MSDIGLVGCSRRKLAHPAPARELYASPLFRLASRFCAATCERWFVLSAYHGLVHPEQIIAPYDVTLRKLDQAGRERWADRVIEQLRQRRLLQAGHRFLLHAGADYADPLAARLLVEQPLRGLAIGQRLAWYRRALAAVIPKESLIEKALRLPAIEVRQGEYVLYCFAVDGKQLAQFTAVSRIKRSDEDSIVGYQRPEIIRHVNQIRQYLESADALLPNALVVAFDERIHFTPFGKAQGYSRLGTLTIPLSRDAAEKVGWLVDGQQRAATLREADVVAFPVCVVGFVAQSPGTATRAVHPGQLHQAAAPEPAL